MEAQNVTLQKDEQVVLEQDGAVVTDRRILALKGAPGPAATWDEAGIKDVLTVQMLSGGQESRMEPGIKLAAVGGVVAVAGALADTTLDLPRFVNLLFLVGLIAFMFGMYFIMSSLLRVKPHTSAFFVIPGRKDIRVSFPGRENAQADELMRAFARVKRETI